MGLRPGADGDPTESPVASSTPYRSPPALLTFLAPADRCNQRCPSCFLEAMGEPVDRFALSPADYARCIRQFVEGGVPILSVMFQGYEVTLPRSWPYVEAVFQVAKEHGIRRGFVTNGMLLHRWTERLVALDVHHVTVSIDASSAETNDRLRGIRGAFDATRQSLRRVVSQAPRLSERLAVASTLYDEANFRSLLDMPRFLREHDISRWAVGWEFRREGPVARPAQSRDVVFRWLAALKETAEAAGVAFYTGDDFGLLDPADREALRARSVYNLSFMYRMDPLGYIRTGDELLDVWDPLAARRWNPQTDNAVETVGYWENALQYPATSAQAPSAQRL